MCSSDPLSFSASISFKWCALPKEMAKCREFITYANMTAQNLSLDVAVECVSAITPEECIAKIKSGKADLATLESGDVYAAGKLRILASMIVLEAKLEARRFYAKHHAIHCLESTLCFETTPRNGSKFNLSFFFQAHPELF